MSDVYSVCHFDKVQPNGEKLDGCGFSQSMHLRSAMKRYIGAVDRIRAVVVTGLLSLLF